MIEIIDNFLEKDEFNKIRDVLMSDNFPWFYNDYITNKNDLSHKFYFTHTFYRQPARISNWFDLWINTLQKLKCNSIIRIKANIYPKNNKEEINKKRGVKCECECGGKYTHNHKARHCKSMKHQKYILSISDN